MSGFQSPVAWKNSMTDQARQGFVQQLFDALKAASVVPKTWDHRQVWVVPANYETITLKKASTKAEYLRMITEAEENAMITWDVSYASAAGANRSSSSSSSSSSKLKVLFP
jgi:hypothetical protein